MEADASYRNDAKQIIWRVDKLPDLRKVYNFTCHAVGLAKAADAQERSFAAAVASDQTEAFAAFEVEGDVLKGPEFIPPKRR